MEVCGIEIPNELNNALANDELVVFAGAGVSMQGPHSLCSFGELVRDIAKDVDPAEICKNLMEDGESCEAALGRLSGMGDVHEACASHLSSNECSVLHKNILGLFGGFGSIRVVTTNFDKRFEDAADRMGLGPRIHVAPALPRGNSFSGIVHLHGSVDWPNEMTLTDSDFGEAYVSGGWAARFLVDMFSKYTVLFVGYSCSDMLVHYLARSVSSKVNGRVFVLEKNESVFKKWRFRGIEPIRISDFDQLPELFGEWSRKASLGLYERAITVRSIAMRCRDLDCELDAGARSELSQLLENPFASEDELCALAKEFVSVEGGMNCLLLLRSMGIDDFLYEEDYPSQQEPFFDWATRILAPEHSEELLALSSEKGKHFSMRFCSSVLRALSSSNVSEEHVAVWLSYFEPRWISFYLGGWHSLKSVFSRTANRKIAFRIVQLAFSFEPDYQKDHMGVKFYFDSHGDASGFGAEILSRSSEIGEQVFEYLISQFEEITFVASAFGAKDSAFDIYSFSRSAIEEHEQDRHQAGTIGTMISTTRDLGIDLLNRGIREVGDFERLLVSPSSLVFRIGLFLIRYGKMEPDQAIDLVVRNNAVSRIGAKHEVFELLRYAYPKATPETKAQLIAYVRERYPNIDEDIDAYERFNLFQWLNRENAKDELLGSELREIAEKHPNFEVREHPDFSYYVSSGWPEEERFRDIGEDELSADYFIGQYQAARNEHRPTYGLFQLLKEYPDKAIEICSDLFQGAENSRFLIAKAFREIDWSSVPAERYQSVIELLRECFTEDSLYPSAVHALKELSEQEEFFACSGVEQLINAALNVGNGWKSETWQLFTDRDWLAASMNSPIGWSCTLLLNYSIYCERNGDDAAHNRIVSMFGCVKANSVDNPEFIACVAASIFPRRTIGWKNTTSFSSPMLFLFCVTRGRCRRVYGAGLVILAIFLSGFGRRFGVSGRKHYFLRVIRASVVE